MGIFSTVISLFGKKKKPVSSEEFLKYCIRLRDGYKESKILYMSRKKEDVARISGQFLHALESLEKDIPRLTIDKAEKKRLQLLTNSIRGEIAHINEAAASTQRGSRVDQESSVQAVEKQLGLLYVRANKYIKTKEKELKKAA